MSYITAADFKSHVDIDPADIGDDGLLSMLASAASQAIDNHCGYPFAASMDGTQYIDASPPYVDGRTLWLPEPLCAITSVTNGNSTAVSSSSYVTLPRHKTPYWGLVLKSNTSIGWTYTSTPEGAIAVVGRWAYSTVPDATIRYVCRELVMWMYRKARHGDAAGDQPIITAGGSVLMPPRIPNHLEAMLAPYRRPRPFL